MRDCLPRVTPPNTYRDNNPLTRSVSHSRNNRRVSFQRHERYSLTINAEFPAQGAQGQAQLSLRQQYDRQVIPRSEIELSAPIQEAQIRGLPDRAGGPLLFGYERRVRDNHIVRYRNRRSKIRRKVRQGSAEGRPNPKCQRGTAGHLGRVERERDASSSITFKSTSNSSNPFFSARRKTRDREPGRKPNEDDSKPHEDG